MLITQYTISANMGSVHLVNLKTRERNGVDLKLGRNNEEDHKADKVDTIKGPTHLRTYAPMHQGYSSGGGCRFIIIYGWRYGIVTHTPQRVQGVRVDTNRLAVKLLR